MEAVFPADEPEPVFSTELKFGEMPVLSAEALRPLPSKIRRCARLEISIVITAARTVTKGVWVMSFGLENQSHERFYAAMVRFEIVGSIKSSSVPNLPQTYIRSRRSWGVPVTAGRHGAKQSRWMALR